MDQRFRPISLVGQTTGQLSFCLQAPLLLSAAQLLLKGSQCSSVQLQRIADGGGEYLIQPDLLRSFQIQLLSGALLGLFQDLLIDPFHPDLEELPDAISPAHHLQEVRPIQGERTLLNPSLQLLIGCRCSLVHAPLQPGSQPAQPLRLKVALIAKPADQVEEILPILKVLHSRCPKLQCRLHRGSQGFHILSVKA